MMALAWLALCNTQVPEQLEETEVRHNDQQYRCTSLDNNSIMSVQG